MIIVHGFHPLTVIAKCSTLDVAAVLDPSLYVSVKAIKRISNSETELKKSLLI